MSNGARFQIIRKLYQIFDDPISAMDCGKKCSPYNEHGAPFCCDTRHLVPAVYSSEWSYYQDRTDLWQVWSHPDDVIYQGLLADTPEDMLLVECLGHKKCQRSFRSIVCRSFPFYPYFNSRSEYIGMAYYWEYEDRCWVISNLDVVSPEYQRQFVDAYSLIFQTFPAEMANFVSQSKHMRAVFANENRTIPLLHRDGKTYAIVPESEQLHFSQFGDFPKYGPYEIAASMPFPDEQ